MKFLMSWDQKLCLSGTKILLLLDNASSHPDIARELTHICLEFLPPNTTSLIQPCDAGNIKNFKDFYRSYLCNRIVHLTEV